MEIIFYMTDNKERPRSKTPTQPFSSTPLIIDSGRNVIYETQRSQQPISEGGSGNDKRGSVLSQLIDKVEKILQ